MRSTMLRTLLVLGLVLLSSTRPAAAGFTWQLLSPSGGSPAPAPRSQAACGLIGNELWVFSGAGQPAADVWVFDLDARTWRRVDAPLQQPAPAARHDAAHGVLQASPAAGRPYPAFIVSHGTRGGSAVLDDTWALWPHNASWTQLPSSGEVPKKRYAPAADIYPGTDLLVMSHGFGKRRYSDVHVYSLSRLSWTKVKSGTNEYDPSKPHSRCLVAGTMVNPASLVLYGGCLQNGFSGGPCPARDAWRLDLDLVPGTPSSSGASTEAVGGSWHEMRWGPSPRTWASLARAPASWGLGAGTAVLLGGSERTKQIITTEDAPDNEVAVLDSTDGSWWRGAAGSTGATPNFRFGACAVTDEAGGRVLLFGGRLAHGPKSLTNDVYALTLSGPPDPAVALPAVQPPSGSGGSALFSPFRRAAGLSAWGTSTHWFTYPQLHGIFMGLSWGIILPLGVLLARHLRHLDPLWFKLHRALQVMGVLLSTIGFVLPWVGGASNPGFAHGIIGILVYFLGLTQPINAYFRPHTGQKWRTQWEYLHKGAGRLAILLGLVNVSLGVMLVDGPAGLWIAWYVILGLGLAAAAGLEVRLQRARRRGGAAVGAGSAATAVLVGKGSSDERDVEELHSPAAHSTAPVLELGKVGGGPKHA